ncbi:MAG: hypothetical protein WKF76_06605 [Nocardioidaceae bacterium]
MTGTPTRSEQRRSRAAGADRQLRALWGEAQAGLDLPSAGAALVAVGGYGRGHLSPASDLDVVLLAVDGYDEALLGQLAERLWYPLWDANVPLDHAVRTQRQLRAAADDDVRVALGLLEMRHIAGDAALTLSSRSAVLAQWRRSAKRRLPLLVDGTRRRWAQLGDLGHATTPDLKESHGGLRDVTVLRALLASWLVDVPAVELDRQATALLEVRDALQETTGRRTERLVADYAAEVAERLGLTDAAALRARVAEIGRGIGHLAQVAFRNVDWMLTPAPAGRPRRPVLEVVAPGVAAYRGEVVLTEKAQPARDPCSACAPPRRRRPVGCCSPTPRRPGWVVSRWRCRCPGRPRPAVCSGACWAAAGRWSTCGRASTSTAWSTRCCRSGRRCATWRRSRRCTGSPSTGIWCRPVSRRPRTSTASTAPTCSSPQPSFTTSAKAATPTTARLGS